LGGSLSHPFFFFSFFRWWFTPKIGSASLFSSGYRRASAFLPSLSTFGHPTSSEQFLRLPVFFLETTRSPPIHRGHLPLGPSVFLTFQRLTPGGMALLPTFFHGIVSVVSFFFLTTPPRPLLSAFRLLHQAPTPSVGVSLFRATATPCQKTRPHEVVVLVGDPRTLSPPFTPTSVTSTNFKSPVSNVVIFFVCSFHPWHS